MDLYELIKNSSTTVNIDTVRIILDYPEEYTFNQSIPGCDYYSSSRIPQTGKYKELKYARSGYGNLVFSGSLVSSIKGNNVEALTIKEIKDFFDEMNRVFFKNGNGFDDAYLSRVDYGVNIFVPKNPSSYLVGLPDLSRFDRSEHYNSGQKNTVSYQKRDNSLCVYNKTHQIQAKSKNIKLKKKYQNTNILRVEYKVLKRLKKTFKIKDAPLSLLWDASFHSKLKEHHEQLSKHIYIAPDNDQMKISDFLFKSKNEFVDLLIGYFLSTTPKVKDEVINIIKEQEREGNLKTNTALNLRNWVNKSIEQSTKLTITIELPSAA